MKYSSFFSKPHFIPSFCSDEGHSEICVHFSSPCFDTCTKYTCIYERSIVFGIVYISQRCYDVSVILQLDFFFTQHCILNVSSSSVTLIIATMLFVTISDIYFELTILFHDFFLLSFHMLGDVRIFKIYFFFNLYPICIFHGI